MIFDLHFQKKGHCEGNMHCNNYVDYSCINACYFSEWLNFWTNKIGIVDGVRIGLLIKKNQCIMPLILSLEKVECEIHFFNKSIEDIYISDNLMECDYIISDYPIKHEKSEIVEKFLLYNTELFVYRIAQKTGVHSEYKKYVYYTSGSTGIPKACIKTEEAIYKEGMAIVKELGLKSSDCILSVVPCNHVFGQSVACIAAALAGAKVTYIDAMSSPTSIIRYIEEKKFDFVVIAPFYLDFLSEVDREIGHSCKFISGGAPLSEKVKKSSLRVFSFYGSTETGVVAINRGDRQNFCAGKLVEGVQITCANKIENIAQESAYSIVVHSAFNAEAYGVVGDEVKKLGPAIEINDYGVVKNGNLYVYGRLDNIININGLKVSTAEIEKMLLQYQGVDKVKVIRKTDGAREYAHAYVVEKIEGSLNKKKLIEFCLQHMEHYKVPREIEFVKDFAYTELGKVRMR